ncbi:MAG TPA: CPBP family intramembrane glutamic endopeptidase [Planctomycetota bacterium]|nr:CPBP family intramembrane glutamic endopeptidase [Planctomycetota bacterium]
MTEPPPSGGRPSAIQPQVKLERRVSPFFATLFYGFITAAAWIWLVIGAKVDPLELWTSTNWLGDIGLGLGAATFIVGMTVLLSKRLGAARDLEKEFGWILGEQRAAEIVFLALLSGVAEEFLFRGALHHFIGPVLATALFAAVHWPVNWSFRLWPLFALLAGALLAAERIWTDSLIAPAVTHAAVNGVNLIRLSRKYRVWKE